MSCCFPQTLDAQTEHDKRRADYTDQLDRKRYVDKINAERQMREEEVRRQEAAVQKQEAMKRKTLEYEAELRQRTELERVKVGFAACSKSGNDCMSGTLAEAIA